MSSRQINEFSQKGNRKKLSGQTWAVLQDRSNPTISSMWTDLSGWQSDNGNTFTRHPKECKPWRGKEEEVSKWGALDRKQKKPHEGIIQFTKPYAGPFTSFETGTPKFLGNSQEIF